MAVDSSEIDNALVAKLGADTTLLGYLPNNVYMDEAPPGSTRFAIVSLVDEVDAQAFTERSHEDALYLVKAVVLSTTTNANATAKNAAKRIDELLDPQPPLPPATLTVPGYGTMVIQRESRIRTTEVDGADSTIRWYHRGGNYRVVMST